MANIIDAYQEQGSPIFLNLTRPYPYHDAVVVIWEDYSRNFQSINDYDKQNICINGKIERFEGKPSIEAKTPSQIIIDRKNVKQNTASSVNNNQRANSSNYCKENSFIQSHINLLMQNRIYIFHNYHI